jgi:hypothetical protein
MSTAIVPNASEHPSRILRTGVLVSLIRSFVFRQRLIVVVVSVRCSCHKNTRTARELIVEISHDRKTSRGRGGWRYVNEEEGCVRPGNVAYCDSVKDENTWKSEVR